MRVRITEVATGRTAEEMEPESWEDAEFRWTEGNMSCDCNRRMLVLMAQGLSRDDAMDEAQERGCSDGQFTIAVLDPNPTPSDEPRQQPA